MPHPDEIKQRIEAAILLEDPGRDPGLAKAITLF